MLLDLVSLKGMHPLLPAVTAAGYGHRAALALQRRGHAPGVGGTMTVERDAPTQATIEWSQVDNADAAQIDHIEITEHGAEAVSLVLVSVARGWTVMTRLQKWEFGDWLLVSPTGERVALEVSGIDGPFERRRLRDKLDQVRQGSNPSARFASVVAFASPEAQLERA